MIVVSRREGKNGLEGLEGWLAGEGGREWEGEFQYG